MDLHTKSPTGLLKRYLQFQAKLYSKTVYFTIYFFLTPFLTNTSFAQSQINYGSTINYPYSGENVFTGDVNKNTDSYNDIILYDAAATPNITVLMHNANANVSFVYTQSWDISLDAGEELWDVKDLDGAGGIDLLTKVVNGNNLELYVRFNNGSFFGSKQSIGTIPNANYTFGTLYLNAGNILDIYFFNNSTHVLNYTTINASFQLQTLQTINLNASSIATHIFVGHFTQNALDEIAYVEETTNAPNSHYEVQVLKNNNGVSLSLDFNYYYNISGYNGSSNQKFYAGKFTNDSYTDIAIFATTVINSNFYVIQNLSGTSFVTPFTLWQGNITQPPNAFTLDVGNYKSNNNTDEILVMETFTAPQFAADLGRTYVDESSYNDFTLIEQTVAPCNTNPITQNSLDYHVVQGDFDQSGAMDFVLYNPTLNLLKAGIFKTLPVTTVQGYSWPQSAAPTETINFYISGTNLPGSIDVFRYESRGINIDEIYVTSLPLPNGIVTQTSNIDVVKDGCGWQVSATLNIPNGWPSGYYAARVTNEFCNNASINFIVRADPNNQSTKKMLLLANTNTWAAYNTYSNTAQAGSKYGEGNVSKYQEYSFMRPSSNNNIYTNENTHLARAELWIYTWLKDNGYDPDVVTDMDVHVNAPNFLNTYDYLVMGTHPEYWTGLMYDHVKDFQAKGAGGTGGNLICLGGNAVFEVVDIDVSNPANPKLIAYPYAPVGANANTATPQNNSQYPFLNPPQVGGLPTSSPFISGADYNHDRFDYFLESYNFGTVGNVINKRSIDLIGTHYMNLASLGVSNTSYTKTLNLISPFFNGIANTVIGINGYNSHDGVRPLGDGSAAGWECDRYTAAAAPPNYPGTPASPLSTPSIYDFDIQVLASSTYTPASDPVVIQGTFFPNGMNNSEIIYVRPTCTAPNKHGFVFTAGSICFGGSLVWNYDIQNNVYNNDLSRLLINVLEHTNFEANIKNVTCSGGNNGSITITQPALYAANSITYSLSGNSPNNTGIFTNLAAGTYQLTISIPNGNLSITLCREYTVGDATVGNFCCSPDAQNLIANTPNLILQSAPTAANLITLYGNGTNTISNKTFYIDDILTIDHDITFNNCTLWFTPTGTIQLQGPYTLDVNTSTLQAACDWWGGIEANDPQQKVKVENNSNIKNAITGINASNNALVEITNSHFVDNQAAGLLMTDMTDPNYAGYVYGSSFDASTPIPLFPNALKVGIDLQNVAKMQIGDYTDEGKGNTFMHVRRGIGIWQGNLPMISNIGIYNNQFDEIKETYYTNVLYPEAYVINNTYNLGYGAAIYAYNGGAPITNAINLDIRNVNAAVNTLAFTNCDKGIVTVHSSLDAENLYMDNVPMGICNYSLIANTSYKANNNKLYNTYIGMQFAGEKMNSEAKGNTIECTLFPNGVAASNVLGADYIWPKGIDVSYFTNTGINSFDISAINNVVNHISIPHYAGIGINLENTGSAVNVKANSVDLGSTDASDNIVCNGATTLAGIASYNALGTHIIRNTINGNTGGANLGNAASRVDACGILINIGENQKIGCNSINNTRFGLMGWNKNNTGLGNELKVQGNTTLGADAGWVFRHLANEGTLGNVGDANNDNNNPFLSLNTSAKVFKYCLGTDPFQIYTNSINQLTESMSENINTLANDCAYQINPNPGAALFNINAACPTLQIIAGTSTSISLSDAIAIATNTKQYIEFPVLAHWYDSKTLYEYLDHNPSIKNSNDTLLDFYNTMSSEAIAQEKNADQKLKELIDNFANLSPAVLEGLWIDASTQNELINDTEVHDANEQRINNIYLRMVRLGMDSLLQDDKDFISTLAPQCPYTAGSAVYKARTLNKYIAPGAMYDDLKICNQVGVYKTGNNNSNNGVDKKTISLITQEEKSLSKIKPNVENISLKLNDIVLYPNPTPDIVNIRYHTNAESKIELYDITGRKIMVVQFVSGEYKTSIDLCKLSNGIYSYKYLIAGVEMHTGKIIKH